MRLIISHYHLYTGGVTKIIESQVKALRENGFAQEIVVATGDCPQSERIKNAGASLIIEERLQYLDKGLKSFQDEFSYLDKFFRKLISKEDILHFHNLNLGKNPVATVVVMELAKEGYNIYNHAHDFAEDRPANMAFCHEVFQSLNKDFHETLYPKLSNYRYITLNSPDKERLVQYGVESHRIDLLPNPVDTNVYSPNSMYTRDSLCSELGIDPAKKLVTYPVRVIRRKNFGEFVLLSVLFGSEANFVVTQPPKNPIEIEYYNDWKKFIKSNGIPVVLEAGNKVDFENLLYYSNFCITTSIQEGFGMTYLEPWFYNTPVVGRNLPYVTGDIIKAGLVFPSLYDELLVQVNEKKVDFPDLTEDEKQKYITNTIKNPRCKKDIIKDNPWLINMFDEISQPTLSKNKEIIKKNFSLEKYAERLKDLYKKFVGK